MRYSVLCRIHYRYWIVGIFSCYWYLLVDCVQNGPVHPLLEFPPPKDLISITPRKHGIIVLYILTCRLYTEGVCISTTCTSTSQRSHPHTTTNKHRIIQCYIYLLVDCVQKGPIRPLLELPPPKDPIPIPLPINMGLYRLQCHRYLLVDCTQKGPVHPLLELPPTKDLVPIPLPGNMGLYSVIDTYM